MAGKQNKHWAYIEEVGIYWLMRFMFLLYTLCGRVVFLSVLYPVVSYYFLSNKKTRLASRDFLKHVKAFTSGRIIKASLLQSYFHFLGFAESMVDKLSAWSNQLKLEDVVIHGRQGIAEQLEHKQGGMIFGSHLGNVEVCRALVTIGEHARLNILTHTKYAQNFNRLLGDANATPVVALIQVTDIGPVLAISLTEKIAAGEIVFIVGYGIPVKNNGRTLSVTFLGEDAHFAQDPYMLAALLECPLHTLFCSKPALCACLLDSRQHIQSVPPQVWDCKFDAAVKPIKIASASNNQQVIRACSSNSFAFGGNNTSLIIGHRYETM